MLHNFQPKVASSDHLFSPTKIMSTTADKENQQLPMTERLEQGIVLVLVLKNDLNYRSAVK